MIFTIYAIICPDCICPRYVGQTQDFESRCKDHLKGNRASDWSRWKKHWIQSLLDQGKEPLFKVLTTFSTDEHLDDAEIFWISELRKRGCPLTNLTEGGKGLRGYKRTEEQKRRMSRAHRGQVPWNKGKHLEAWDREKKSRAVAEAMTSEVKAKLSASASRSWTPERRKKMSESKLQLYASGFIHPCKGRNVSDETRRRISDSRRKGIIARRGGAQ